MKFLKKIPDTSNQKYISGYYSLNCPNEEGIIADWHPRYYWYSNTENDSVPLYNTTDVLGDYGIKKRTILYSNDDVYIADFTRAIADLILLKDDINEFRHCTEEFLNTEEEKKQLYELLVKINEKKDILWFLKDEFPTLYYRRS